MASAGKTLVELFGLARELNVEAEGIDIGPSPTDAALAADLALPIEDLELTVRSYNCLKREGIHTVGELVARSEADLLDIRNFGAKSIDEVKEKLAELGLSLKDSPPGFDPTKAAATTTATRATSPRTSSTDLAGVWCPRRAVPAGFHGTEEKQTMPTPTKGPRLGGGPAHERLMLANLATSLFEHKRITTTEAKAKRLRPLAERLITFAKRGDLHARRRVLTVVRDKGVVHELFTEIAPAMAERNGGYTRITKIGHRKGDNAPMAVIELVLEPLSPKQATVKEAEKATDGALGAVGDAVDWLGGRALVVGLSLGGYVGIAHAARHPEQVAGLVAAGCSTQPTPVVVDAWAVAARGIARLPDAGAGLNQFMVDRTLAAAAARRRGGWGFALDVMVDALRGAAIRDAARGSRPRSGAGVARQRPLRPLPRPGASLPRGLPRRSARGSAGRQAPRQPGCTGRVLPGAPRCPRPSRPVHRPRPVPQPLLRRPSNPDPPPAGPQPRSAACRAPDPPRVTLWRPFSRMSAKRGLALCPPLRE